MTGAGAAAVGVATVVPGSLDAHGASSPAVEGVAADSSADAVIESLTVVACINDLASGEITVMTPENEITVTDPDLARRLAELSRQEA